MTEDPQGALAYLVYRDGDDHQRTFTLEPAAERVRIGRGAAMELRLGWDHEVSRVHAELEPLGEGWAVIDDGLSANGTWVNGERLTGRRRLSAGDEIRVGTTGLIFHTLAQEESVTVPAIDWPPVQPSRMQRQVLVALCRPYRAEATRGVPATNQRIADELQVSVAAVKTHLRALFAKFDIAELPQNQKRARLALLALQRGVVGERELAD